MAQLGLWRHFHWSVLLRWDVVAWVIGAALAVGALVLVFDQYSLANVCFVFTAGLIFAKGAQLAITAKEAWWQRTLFTFLLFGIVGVTIVEVVRGVNHFAAVKRSKETTTPSSQPQPPSAPHPEQKVAPQSSSLEHPLHQKLPPREKAENHPPIFVETAPTFGNLAERARALSDEIMGDLYMHGWSGRENRSEQQSIVIQKMPTDSEGLANWTRSRSSYFQFRFFERVLEIRNEFAQLHLRDQQLDDFFKYQGMIEQANRQMATAAPGRNIDIPILPQQIEEVAKRLKALANQIPIQRAAPRPLDFSVTRVQPQKSEFPFEMVVTIKTAADITAGYIVVEFEGPRASMGTDFADSKLILPNDEDIIGNKPLKEYLLSHPFGDTYALEIGKTPFTPRKPIHVVAYGRTPFSVPSVTLFDK